MFSHVPRIPHLQRVKCLRSLTRIRWSHSKKASHWYDQDPQFKRKHLRSRAHSRRAQGFSRQDSNLQPAVQTSLVGVAFSWLKNKARRKPYKQFTSLTASASHPLDPAKAGINMVQLLHQFTTSQPCRGFSGHAGDGLNVGQAGDGGILHMFLTIMDRINRHQFCSWPRRFWTRFKWTWCDLWTSTELGLESGWSFFTTSTSEWRPLLAGATSAWSDNRCVATTGQSTSSATTCSGCKKMLFLTVID